MMTKRKKVLIVDDDNLMRMMVLDILQKLTFVDFFEAENGEEAIKIASEIHPHLILMDVIMPKLDGYDTCRQIKNDPALHSSIVIFMTSLYLNNDINEKIIDAGGEDILRKPINATELYFRVKNYLMLAKARSNKLDIELNSVTKSPIKEYETLALGQDFFYRFDAKTLYKGDLLIPLMNQEILLLEELLNHRNQIVTYDQILNVISNNCNSSIANIRTLVKLIRSKTYKELINTLPSVGYRIIL